MLRIIEILNNYLNMKIIKVKNAKNVLTSIKVFSKKYIIIINKILNLVNKVCEFFEKRHSFFIIRVFFHSKNDSLMSNLND